MNNSTTISNASLRQPGMDFLWLRQEGIKHLQRLSGTIWTDHNLHDPGITMLDQLCYALTDLSYRIDFDMNDLLKSATGDSFHSLYSPAQILTCNPVTLLDLRKIVIDVSGVKNAWIEVVQYPDPEIYLNPIEKSLSLIGSEEESTLLPIKGLYRVFVEKKENERSDISADVHERLMACRNVCEDFTEIRILESQLIEVSGTIEVGQVENIDEFVATIFIRLSNAISPRIRFYTLEEMLAKGRQMDNIIDGPLLIHGFIDDAELMRFDRQFELHTSDMIRELMDAPGVNTVSNIALRSGNKRQEWQLVLDPEKTPKLNVAASLEVLVFTKNESPVKVNYSEVQRLYDAFLMKNDERILERSERDLIPKEGQYRSPHKYHSIQYQFPKNYGIGELGLSETATTERKAQAQQLKAYLLFFDQLIANYFAQIERIPELFSFHSKDATTYFHQSLYGVVPGAEQLLNFKDTEAYDLWLKENTAAETVNLDRKNRFLNHLLARFSESFTDYSLQLFDYSNKGNNMLAPMEQSMKDKMRFLQNYPTISCDRFKAIDYTKSFYDSDNRSGLEKRIAAKLGIPIPKGKRLSEATNDEGFYLLEHILLRPISADYTAYLDFLVSQKIEAFEDEGNGYVRCTSNAHGLQNGEYITINGTGDLENKGYDASYMVENVLPDYFSFKTNFIPEISSEEAILTLKPTWIRTKVDTTILLLTLPIEVFSQLKRDKTRTNCKVADHGLVQDEMIEINGTNSYSGKYVVTIEDEHNFSIDCPFTTTDTNARFMSNRQKRDPYSLQLTVVFPDWPDRFQDKKDDTNNFRSFIERTIREETPVHLTVYVRWLNQTQMLVFEKAYEQFLQQLTIN